MEEILNKIVNSYQLVSIIVFLFFATILICVFYKAHKNKTMDWSDLLTINGPSNKVSFPKLIQLVVLITGTWIVINLTLSSNMTTEIFATYLTFSAGSEAYSKYLAVKNSKNN